MQWRGGLAAGLAGALAIAACGAFEGDAEETTPTPVTDGGVEAAIPEVDAGSSPGCSGGVAEERDAAPDANCNGDGLAVDLLSSDGNCGRCGRSCGGDGCTGGLCNTPTVVKGAGGSVLALHGSELFWAPFGFLKSATRSPLDGGDSTPFATSGPSAAIMAIAVDDARIYVNAQDDIFSVPGDTDGGQPRTSLTPNANTRFDLALDDTHVYWRIGNQIEGTKKDGTGPVEFVSSANAENAYAATIAADSTGLYWTTVGQARDGAAPFPNRLYTRNGPNVVVRAKDFGTPAGLVLDATYVYWVDVDKQEVLRVERAGARPHEVVARWTTAKPFVRGLHVDDTHVYWMVTALGNTYEAHLFRAPKCGGGDVETLAVTEGASGIVDDGTSIYFQSLGNIRRVRK